MHQISSVKSGTLYIVATPIGNLEDITLRALRILKEVDIIAAEDTRHSKRLLNHYDIHTKLMSYYREKEVQKAEYILSLLADGLNVALVSDAGTPGISDPGAVLVNRIRKENIPVVPIPGPSALTTALCCSGFSEGTMLFVGFPPSKKKQRRQLLQSLIHSEHHVVCYESPHRVQSLLEDAYEVFGNRQVFMARELTKTYEELEKSDLSTLLQKITDDKNRGEYVLIFSPGKSDVPEEMSVDELIVWYRDNTELSLKDTCKKLSADLGLSRSKIYQKALDLWKNN